MKTRIFNFRHGILDIDGTLLDDKKLYRWMLARVLPLALSENSSELYLPTGGLPLPWWAKPLHQLPGLTGLTLMAEWGIFKLCDAIDSGKTRLFAETEEVLHQLSEKGVKLFATTGSETPDITLRLQKAGILDFFTLVAGSEISKREHIPYFAKGIDLPLEDFVRQAFLVSDGPVELSLASKYGVYGIGVTNTLSPSLLLKAGAKEVISNLGELLN